MSEDVCESWEDWLIKEDNKISKDQSKPNGLTNKSTANLKSSSANSSKSKNKTSANKLNDKFTNLYLNDSIGKLDEQHKKKEEISYSSVLNKNLPLNNVKILTKSGTTSSTNSNDINPFGVQITFEDNSARSQLMPQLQQQNVKVKILQRPKQKKNGTCITDSNLAKNGFFNAKTIQEREAEYARARERILGTDYKTDELEQEMNNQLGKKDENLIRTAQGPNFKAAFAQRR